MEADEEGQKQAASLCKALQVPPFALVLGSEAAAALRRGEPSPLTDAHASLDLGATSEMMVVSDQSKVLRAAKQARIFSCFFVKRLPGAPGSLPASFRAEDLMGVQHAIEELNGVTFRDADTEIRSQYGVYQT